MPWVIICKDDLEGKTAAQVRRMLSLCWFVVANLWLLSSIPTSSGKCSVKGTFFYLFQRHCCVVKFDSEQKNSEFYYYYDQRNLCVGRWSR